MPNTIEGYINGKPLNPNRDLPHRTLAQAQAEGLTSSNRLWVRTDGQNTPISAEQISYDSNNSVKDKIDWVYVGELTTSNNFDISQYNELNFIPMVNGAIPYNPYFAKKISNTIDMFLSIFQDSSYNASVKISINNGIATLTQNTLNGWSSMRVRIYARK